MGSSPGRPAAIAPKGYSRPKADHSGLVVVHTTEDGLTRTDFDFRELDCPEELRKSLVAGFAVACGQGGRWRSSDSAKAGAVALRRFVRDIGQSPESPQRIEDLGPQCWLAWKSRIAMRSRRSGTASQVRSLLLDTPGLPEPTRRAVRTRIKKPSTRLFDAYSRDEFQRIRAAAVHMVRTAKYRIDANTAVLQQYRAGEEPDNAPAINARGTSWTAGSILDHLARTGSVPPCFRPGGPAAGKQAKTARSLLVLDGAFSWNEALFPNSSEIFALSVLLVCERGYNRSVIRRLTVDIDRADDHATEKPIHLLQLDKPRRGPTARFSGDSLTDGAGRLIELAVSLTTQARETIHLLGSSTTSLLVHRHGRNIPSAEGAAVIFSLRFDDPGSNTASVWHKRAALSDDDGNPLQVTHQRLRLTEQVLNRRPRQNSPSVSEEIYRRPDPQIEDDAAVAIIRGQEDALRHARATMEMRTLTSAEIVSAQRDPRALAARLGVSEEKVHLLVAGALDTVLGACLDFAHSPFAESPGGGCPASFLACLGCSNAVATPAHVPRLVALSMALERIASAVTQGVWDEDYAATYARLTDLLQSNTTPEQRAHAVQKLSDADQAAINRLFSRDLDI